MRFTIKGREGLGRELWQKCHELCWILLNCSTNPRHTRVSFPSLMDKMPEITTSKKAPSDKKKSFNIDIKMKDFSDPITKVEKGLIRSAASVLMFVVIYAVLIRLMLMEMIGRFQRAIFGCCVSGDFAGE